MPCRTIPIVLTLLLLAFGLTAAQTRAIRLYDLKQQRMLVGNEAIEALATARFVLVGEHHDDPEHHKAQLRVIQALEQAGRNPAIALEMFRSDGQADLNRWVTGKISEDRFKQIYLKHWNYDWNLYAPIFRYAREHRIPMVGLNVPPGVTSQVAYHGFASLSEKQRGQLEGITCDVTQAYRDFIRRAYGSHGHNQLNFERFCEAQLVWDTAMAMNANDYAGRHPDKTIVILAGSGHARKPGIPAQLKKIGAPEAIVILPRTPDVFDIETLTSAEADDILMDW